MPGQEQEDAVAQPSTVVLQSDLAGIQPPSFDWNAPDLPHAFRSFKRYCEIILKTPIYANKKPEDIVNYILLWLGPKGVEIFDNLTLSEAEQKLPDKVWQAFKDYIEPKSNFRLARFQLRDMMQTSDEPIDNYMTRLRIQAKNCSFEDEQTLEDNVLDQLIKGVAHQEVRKKLLDHDPSKLTLTAGINMARTFEATQTQLQQMAAQPNGANIGAIKKKDQSTKHTCGNCGRAKHNNMQECPARDDICNKCKKLGHWGKVCRSMQNKSMAKTQRQDRHDRRGSESKRKPTSNYRRPPRGRGRGHIHSVHQEDLPEQFEDMNFSSITVLHQLNKLNLNAIRVDTVNRRTEAYCTVQIEPWDGAQATLKGKVDTGAQGNVLPLRTYAAMYPDDLDKKGLPMSTHFSKARLIAYNGTTIPQYGTIPLRCRYQNQKWLEIDFFVAETPGPVILGFRMSEDLGIIQMNCAISSGTKIKQDLGSNPPIRSSSDLKKMYQDLFTGIGKFPGQQKLTLHSDANPVIHAPRRAPIQLREAIKAELDRMQSLGVIRPVTEPTDWVSSITYVKKADGSLRICIDPKDLNKALKRSHHHTPTLEELTHKFAGAQVFSKMDAKSGYWSVQLHPESQLLTTFNSPFGRFCFNRLPFGLKVSQDIFQQAMDQVLQDLPGVVAIADDITVYGKDEEEHDVNLHRLMTRARERGLVFNPAKCIFKTKEIPFFGSIYAANGVRPDPQKVQAITDIRTPECVQDLQSFLGMVTYLAPFIPCLSEHTTPLRQLLHQESLFQWQSEHQNAFDTLKHLIQEASTLSYFDPNLPSVLQVDASQTALGAVLTQQGKPVAFASKSLTDTETRYANIEREMLACVFGAERFHTYIYGKSFIIESDHKPLEMISRKTLTAAPARLQRMLLRLQRYDYTIKYRPGKEMVLADSLSRMRKTRTANDKEINLEHKVCFIQFATQRLLELQEETKKDTELSILLKTIVQGFPERQRDIHSEIKPYWAFRDQLSIEDGLVLKGECIIIPAALRKRYLQTLHDGHQGITRCQQRAHTSIYWPGINKDIEDMVSHCAACQMHQASQQREPMEPTEYPPIPWHTIGTDLFHHNDKNYLIISDYFTKYFIVEELNTTTSQVVANRTSKTLSLFGLPNTIISDNGPQFIGKPYQDLMNKHGISHITSSPHHPQGHGFIERQIRTVKAVIKKEEKDTDAALLSLRTTPLGPSLSSPAELMFKRKIQNTLPVRTQGPDSDSMREHYMKGKQGHSTQHTSTKELRLLNMNEPVFYQDPAKRTWTPGTIIGYGPEPRSYTIRCETTGHYLRRNRVLIRPRRLSSPTPTSNTRFLQRMLPPPNMQHSAPISQQPSTPSAQEPATRPIPAAETTDVAKSQLRRSTRERRPTRRLLNEV